MDATGDFVGAMDSWFGEFEASVVVCGGWKCVAYVQ